MMIIQILLIIFSFSILGYFLFNPGSTEVRAYKKIGLLVFVVMMIVSILKPEYLNWLAKLAGVGRGADLLLYLFIMAFMFFALNMYIKFKQQQDKINRLARKLALLEAQPQTLSKKRRK